MSKNLCLLLFFAVLGDCMNFVFNLDNGVSLRLKIEGKMIEQHFENFWNAWKWNIETSCDAEEPTKT